MPLLAFRVEHSAGRRYPEPAHPYRNDFQRDRDRVIHSRAFRRMENKTQVFTTRYSDHFRNRLTHTIEVAQIARTVGGALGLNIDLCEALALAHDIGHPPFGHSGEKSLNVMMRRFGERFDHNLHALRIVEVFEQRYAAFPGLNLTFEVREGIIKHSRDYSAEEYPELAEYRLGDKPPLEAQLIDFADEVAYNTADLDDGAEAELLSAEQIRAGVPLFEQLYERVEAVYPKAAPKLKFSESIRRLVDALATDLIENSRRMIAAAGVGSVEEVRKHPAPLIGLSPEIARHNSILKAFLYSELYDNPQLRAEREAGAEMVTDLFRIYLHRPELLPQSHQARAGGLHRVICDYIAGMTDHFLRAQFRNATGR